MAVLLTSFLFGPAAKSQQAAKGSRSDSESQAVQEAIQFEKAKLAAAKAQAAKDALATPTKKVSEANSVRGIREAIQFERPRLRETVPAPQERATARLQEAFPKWRYIVPATALGLAVLGMLVGARLLRRRPEAPVASSGQFTETTMDGNQGSFAASPPPVPDRSEREAKTSGGSSIPAEVVHQVLPTVPRESRNIIRGKVKVSVRVRVDLSGKVVDTRLDFPGPSKYFAKLAVQAARRWKFVPTKTDNRAVAVSSEWVLRFEFAKSGTRVVAVKDGAVFATAQVLAKVGRPVARFQFPRSANQLSQPN